MTCSLQTGSAKCKQYVANPGAIKCDSENVSESMTHLGGLVLRISREKAIDTEFPQTL
jgi:hypothetical protein